jgi:hypothetical protein
MKDTEMVHYVVHNGDGVVISRHYFEKDAHLDNTNYNYALKCARKSILSYEEEFNKPAYGGLTE